MSPGSVVFQGEGNDPYTDIPKSSWSFKGKPLPFVPWVKVESVVKQLMAKNPKQVAIAPCYLEGLKDEAAVSRAVIAVEKTNGPILLVSGEDDRMWPSALMCRMVEKRLKQHKFRYDYRNLEFKNSGHNISPPGYMITTGEEDEVYAMGGNPGNNAHAQDGTWKAILSFLKKHF
ncbi:MAG: hypothetical protein GY765_03790 [bacterium]|nr:hypothetical protein [bacterium]